jgi:ribosomal protein S27AE
MSDALTARIDRLEAANRSLETQVIELREQLARSVGYHSIRDSRRCPACGSGSLFHVRRAQETGHSAPVEFALTHERSIWKGTIAHGAMESFACRKCGLVEWHVIDFEGVVADGHAVVAIEAEPAPPKSGPFR